MVQATAEAQLLWHRGFPHEFTSHASGERIATTMTMKMVCGAK